MSELSYRDHCVISRVKLDEQSKPMCDEWDNLLMEEIYNGECDFQGGGQTALSVVSHRDVVYLPEHVMVEINDIIEVTTQFGRKRKGVVGDVNDLGIDLLGDCLTEIEIKNSYES